MSLFLLGFYEILLVFLKQSQYFVEYNSAIALVWPNRNNNYLAYKRNIDSWHMVAQTCFVK